MNKNARKRRKNKIKQGSLIVSAILYTIAVLLALVTLYPLVYIISNSISDPVYSSAGKVWLFPKGFTLEAYKYVLDDPTIVRSFYNSVLYTVIMSFAVVFLTMMFAFGLSKKDLLFKKAITIYLLITMWFGGGLIPSFLNMTRLGLYNSLLAVFLPSLFNVYFIILARTSITRIPPSLFEAATIDGASVPSLFFRVVIPLSKPIMAVLALYTALAIWNEWYAYMIYLPAREDLHPLAYYLVRVLQNGQALISASNVPKDASGVVDQQRLLLMLTQLKYAISVITTVPIMCLYPFAQKYFVQGVMLGSLKE